MDNWNNPILAGSASMAGLGALGLLHEQTLAAQRQRLANYKRFEMTLPVDMEPDAAVHLLIDLLAPLRRKRGQMVFDVIIFEVTAVDGRIRHAIELSPEREEYSRAAIHASLPGARLVAVDEPPPVPPTAAIELALTNLTVPLRAEAPAASSRSILAAMQPLRPKERLRVTWILANGEAPRHSDGKWSVLSTTAMPPEQSSSQMDPDVRRKRAAPLVEAVGRIGAWTADDARARQLTGRVLAAMQSVAAPGVRIVKRKMSDSKAVRRMTRRDVPLIEFPSVFNTREMVAILGLPLESPRLPGVELIRGRTLAPAPQLPYYGRPLGHATFAGRERPVAVPFAATSRHTWIVGPSGSGKSWLLAAQALADIAQPRRPVVVIDMKSDTVAAIGERYPEVRYADLRILDVTSSRPLGLNPLGGGREPELVADALFAIFKRLWGLQSAPRTSDLLHVALLTLARTPGSTLVDLAPLLTNRSFRSRVTAKLSSDLVIGSYWSQFAELSEGERAQVISPLLTRVRQVLLRSDLRVMLGQRESTVDFDRILKDGLVLLVPLSAGTIGPESAALLSAVVLSELWSAATRRAAIPERQRRPAAVYIDEWQLASAAVTDMAEVLSLARGFGVGFTLANQYPTQLSPELRDAVTTNAATKVVFATSAANAASVAKEFEGVTADDIQGLGRFEAVASVALDDTTAPPVTIRTEPLEAPHRAWPALRLANAEAFGRPRVEVEADIAARYSQPGDTDTPGVRRRQS